MILIQRRHRLLALGALCVLTIITGCAAPQADVAPAAQPTFSPAQVAPAGTVPAGWQVLSDAQRGCLFAVPADWQPLAGQPAAINTGVGASASLIPGQAPQAGWDALKQDVRAPYDQIGKVSVLLDDGSRYWFQVTDPAKRMLVYYGAVRGPSGTCAALVNVPEQQAAALASTPRQILSSVNAAAPQ